MDKTIKAFAEVVVEQVRDNAEDVQIPGLGTFKQKCSEARKGRNPFNGEEIEIKSSKTIKFQVSSTVKKVSE